MIDETNNPSESPADNAPHRWARRLRLAIDLAVIATLLGAVVGYYLRDRYAPLAVLTYFPLPAVAAGAFVWDLLRRGRTLGRARFALAVVAIVFVVIGGRWMWATEPLDRLHSANSGPIRLIHWNVKWGGGLRTPGIDWDPIADELAAHTPDVIVLSEAPQQVGGDDSDWDFAEGWSTERWYGSTRAGYYWSVVVSSRWPVHKRWQRYLDRGVAMRVDIDAPHGPLRLLVVDGDSDPRRDRLPFLAKVADAVERAAADGEPVDIVVGDFNALSRSIGFDRYERAPLNLRLAGRRGGGWRATGPAILPLIDVDHAWLAPTVRLTGIERFTRSPSDHVGYALELYR